MKNNAEKWGKHLLQVQKMCVSLVAGVICTWAFFQNAGFAKIIISPFLVCSFAMFLENVFWLCHCEKLARVFKYLFRISFFAYFFGFLGYTLYYSIAHKSYDLLLVIAIFSVFGAYFFKKAFFSKKEP